MALNQRDSRPEPRRVHRGLAKPRVIVAGFAAEEVARVAVPAALQAGPPKQTGPDELLDLEGAFVARMWPGQAPAFTGDNLLWHRRRGLASDEQIIDARRRRETGGQDQAA